MHMADKGNSGQNNILDNNYPVYVCANSASAHHGRQPVIEWPDLHLKRRF